MRHINASNNERASALAKHFSFERNRCQLFAITAFIGFVFFIGAFPVRAGGYVAGGVVLDPANSINTGAISVTPTFNNDQFNDQILVGTINNDPIRTPSTSDPVSTVSGNNYHDETDFVIRGRNGLNIVFTRTYNSSTTNDYSGLGNGWVHSYSMQLQSNDFGDCPNCTSAQRPENGNKRTSSITYVDERGGEQNFLVNESNHAVTKPKGVYDNLTLDSPIAGQYTLTFRNGTKYIFESRNGDLRTTPYLVARLRYIDNAWGDRLTLSYDLMGRLSTITDNLDISGRTGITFNYYYSLWPLTRLYSVTDWTGRSWSFTYNDETYDLESVTNPLSQTTTYGYHEPFTSLLTSITKPLQRDGQPVQTKFAYYANRRAFKQTNSFDLGDTLDYDLFRKRTRVTDARGFVREYFYDENGRMTKLVEPDGGVLLFENQGDAIRSKKYDALGYATIYSYRNDKAFAGTSDAFGNVTRKQTSINPPVDMTYGPLDMVATIKDESGTIMTTTFSPITSGCDYLNRPRETRISSLSGITNVLLSSQCWNSNGTLNFSRAYLSTKSYRETRLTYEPGTNGLNVSQEMIVGMPTNISVTKTYTYDNLGRKRTVTLRRRTSPTNAALINLTTTFEYDALDRVIKITDALGNEVINDFDANGQLWKLTHRYRRTDGSYDVREVSTKTFDAADRMKTNTDADGNVTTYTYDNAGNVIAVIDAEGHTTQFEYDAMNRRTAVVDATGYRTETTYNLRGDITSIKNANDEALTFEINALGQKTAAIDAKGYRTEFRYDYKGNLTCTIDANAQAGLQPLNTWGCSEYRTYDELNRVSSIFDALSGEISFTYDYLGDRLTVKETDTKIWNFFYDDLGRLSGERDHSGRNITYRNDEAGNVYEKINRLNETTRYTFDNGNRLKRVDYLKDGTAETFGYDAAGNRDSVANSVVSYSFIWDRLNRLERKTDSRGRALRFTYDKVGNILTKTTYQNTTTNYVYNAANRLVMLRNPEYTQVDYQYDPAGRLLSRVTANGARMTQVFDANGWLSKLSQYDAAGALISESNYLRDRVGNVTTLTDTNGVTTYTLDALSRLRTVNNPATANDELFTYDGVGNRKSYTRGSLTANANTRYYNYTPYTNRLNDIRIGSTSGTLESWFTYNYEGQLTTQNGVGAKTLTWDAKGRVSALGSETYTYDPMDYRIGRNGGSMGNRSYFLEGEHLESEYSGGSLLARYFRGSSVDELVAAWMLDTDNKVKPYLFHHDQVNSVTAVSGHNGGTTQNARYTAFGQAQTGTGSSPNRLKYTGREDDGTGLYYYRARYYDPTIGRFISEDPKGFQAGINFYAYVGNNPINANDPSGMTKEKLLGILAEISNRYENLQCAECANAMLDAAKKNGASGNLVVVRGNGGSGFIWSDNYGNNISRNGTHYAVEIDGNVYDNHNPEGISRAEFEGDLFGSHGLNFTNIPFGGTNGFSDAGKAILGLAGVSLAVISDELKAAVNDPLQAMFDWSPLSDVWDAAKVDAVGEGSALYGPGTPFSTSQAYDRSSAWDYGYGSYGSFGGFVLYPNKPNNNMMQSVYSK